MELPWEESRAAFAAAADWFVRTTAAVGDRWDQTGLGEWDLRALVGHTSRALLTVEDYLERPAAAIEIGDPVEYIRSASTAVASNAVAQRGRDAGNALGDDPAGAVARIAARVLPLLDGRDGTEVVTTIVGGMRLRDYLPTRTFELTVHTADIAVAVDEPLDVPEPAATQALSIVTELAVTSGLAGQLLLTATGRHGHTTGWSVL
jgi:Mycothiol maleylpyruvate isomerase N-terminal domain